MENKKLQESFEAMKKVFATAIRNAEVSSAETAIEIITMHFNEYHGSSSHSFKGLELIQHSESHWFIVYAPQSETKTFIFSWNTDNGKSNYKILEYNDINVNVHFLKNAKMLLVQFTERTDMIAFDLDTMQLLNHETVPVKEKNIPEDYINPIVSGDEKYAALFGGGFNSIGILDIQKKKILYTKDLIRGKFGVWEYKDILVIKRIDESGHKDKKSFLVLMLKDDNAIKLACLELPSKIKDVKFFLTSIRVSLDFIADEERNNCHVTLPLSIEA
jgi:hypothetical protein